MFSVRPSIDKTDDALNSNMRACSQNALPIRTLVYSPMLMPLYGIFFVKCHELRTGNASSKNLGKSRSTTRFAMLLSMYCWHGMTPRRQSFKSSDSVN